MNRPYFDPMKAALDDDLNKQVKIHMLLRAKRDQIIEEVEELEKAILTRTIRRDNAVSGSAECRKLEAEIQQLSDKRTKCQEMLFQYADRLEREESHLEELRKIWINVHNSREIYTASEKLPPLWFRLVILAFWVGAILILIGILPRG